MALSKLNDRISKISGIGDNEVTAYYNAISKIDKSKEGLQVLKSLILGFEKSDPKMKNQVAEQFPKVVKTLEGGCCQFLGTINHISDASTRKLAGLPPVS